jgi:hypothetical protein
MSTFRKVDIRVWSDEKFRNLSRLPPSGQSLWFFLLTGPFTGSIPGLFKAGPAAMAEELGWTPEAFALAYAEVIREGMVEADSDAHLIWLPNAIKYNPPTSLNVIKAWEHEIEKLPECPLLYRALDAIEKQISTMGEGFIKSFASIKPKPMAKTKPKLMTNDKSKPLTSPIQEKEKEKEKEKEFICAPLNSVTEENSSESDSIESETLPEDAHANLGKLIFDKWQSLGDKAIQPASFLAFAGKYSQDISPHIRGIHSDLVLRAIDNFRAVATAPPGTYYWSQKITLRAFFEKHLEKFLPGNFDLQDFVEWDTGSNGAHEESWDDRMTRLRAKGMVS